MMEHDAVIAGLLHDGRRAIAVVVLTIAALAAVNAACEVATDIRAIDGDTIEVTLDGERETVRYYSIDAPEIDEPGGIEALRANARLIEGGVMLVPGGDGRDRDVYGRLLRKVYTLDGEWIEETLVEEGHATWR